MRLRIRKTPWGAARFAYSYLGAILAGGVAGLLAVIANLVMGSMSVCKADQEGYCGLGWAAIVGLAALFACFFLAGHALRLGWQWATWLVALTLILTEIVIETNGLDLVWILLLLPALAAALAFERPDRKPKKIVTRVRIAAMIVALAQFVVWLIILLVTD